MNVEQLDNGAVRWRFEQVYLKPGFSSDINALLNRVNSPTCQVTGRARNINASIEVISVPDDIANQAMITRLILMLLEAADFVVLSMEQLKDGQWHEVQMLVGGEMKNLVMSEIGRIADARALEPMLTEPSAKLTLDISSPLLCGGKEVHLDIPVMAAYETMLQDGAYTNGLH